MSAITTRTATESDRAFLLELYASTREAEMAMVPWSAEQRRIFVEMQFAAQWSGYRNAYPDAEHSVIVADGEPAGRIYFTRGAEKIHILDITIAPSSRNRGIGSRVLQALLDEARAARKAVSIYVEDFNPSRRLFERLGFRVVQHDGFQLLLERPPESAGE
jgi:RimJ/RimL family protein N-acetyltransferase